MRRPKGSGEGCVAHTGPRFRVPFVKGGDRAHLVVVPRALNVLWAVRAEVRVGIVGPPHRRPEPVVEFLRHDVECCELVLGPARQFEGVGLVGERLHGARGGPQQSPDPRLGDCAAKKTVVPGRSLVRGRGGGPSGGP